MSKLQTDETVTVNTTKGEQRLAYILAWILEEITCDLAEKAKEQVNLHPVDDSEDDRLNGDGAVPEPDVHGEEVAIKTVTVESAMDKGNLEEAQQLMPGMDETGERVCITEMQHHLPRCVTPIQVA